jgi:hypothetical protein
MAAQSTPSTEQALIEARLQPKHNHNVIVNHQSSDSVTVTVTQSQHIRVTHAGTDSVIDTTIDDMSENVSVMPTLPPSLFDCHSHSHGHGDRDDIGSDDMIVVRGPDMVLPSVTQSMSTDVVVDYGLQGSDHTIMSSVGMCMSPDTARYVRQTRDSVIPSPLHSACVHCVTHSLSHSLANSLLLLLLLLLLHSSLPVHDPNLLQS